ncbi:hypothetical protein AVEN_270544-1 [Araneus ventricosus]|uniref:Uncharacterized protein n=1 Tax=Araneus ventricosus TaxID=182803 RepID=A0A4Y2B5H0_ARAVE|nr:hypothetical protein AVEN_270544-1 [Araneus ventricosus]
MEPEEVFCHSSPRARAYLSRQELTMSYHFPKRYEASIELVIAFGNVDKGFYHFADRRRRGHLLGLPASHMSIVLSIPTLPPLSAGDRFRIKIPGIYLEISQLRTKARVLFPAR